MARTDHGTRRNERERVQIVEEFHRSRQGQRRAQRADQGKTKAIAESISTFEDDWSDYMPSWMLPETQHDCH